MEFSPIQIEVFDAMKATTLAPVCSWYAKIDLIYAWIMNRWIVYRERAQPPNTSKEYAL